MKMANLLDCTMIDNTVYKTPCNYFSLHSWL